MGELEEPLSRLVEELEKLPGIGRRTAERLAYHVLKGDRDAAVRLARAIVDVKDKLRPCRECFNVSEAELCRICASPTRDRSVICIVESTRDLIAIEKTGSHRGLYHVLMGRVSPHEGAGLDKTTFAALGKRISAPEAGVKEVIIATNPDAEGDTTALVLREHLEGLGIKVTRLARGIPTGGSIEFANVEILRDAFAGRKEAAGDTLA